MIPDSASIFGDGPYYCNERKKASQFKTICKDDCGCIIALKQQISTR